MRPSPVSRHYVERPSSIDSRLVELTAQLRDLEVRVVSLELDVANHRSVASDNGKRLDAMSRDIRQLCAAVERVVDDFVPVRLLSERACNGVERVAGMLDALAREPDATLADNPVGGE